MRSGSHTGDGERETDGSQAQDAERDRGSGRKALYVIGIGPGDPAHMSERACAALKEAEAVAGYTAYIDLIRPLIGDRKVVSTAMKKEVDRVGAALDLAMSGTPTALVSSGDPGVYAMAGLVFEMCKERGVALAESGDVCGPDVLCIEVVPGIPALCSGGALLGAPLTHDFAVVSLSDLLTPWELIEKRLEAAASADFTIVLFNPKSKKRDWQLARACEIVSRHRGPDTPVGVVQRAMREGERVFVIRLADLPAADVDMQTTVFIGNSSSFAFGSYMVTPRGYSKKYDMESKTAEK